MGNFCTKCGKPLADGEVCNCQGAAPQIDPAQQAAPQQQSAAPQQQYQQAPQQQAQEPPASVCTSNAARNKTRTGRTKLAKETPWHRRTFCPSSHSAARSQPERLSPLGRLPSWQTPYQQP